MTRPRQTAPKPRPKQMEVIATVGALRKWLEQFPANAKVCPLAEFAEASMSIIVGNKEVAKAKLTGY
jgi:hypothetical protein